QEEELRATSEGEIVKVVKDRGSGLRENRPGLNRVLTMIADGSVTVVRVTHEDRLARFGVGWLKRLFSVYGVTLEVLHPKKSGGRDELLEDFVSLVTTFAGRLYGCALPRPVSGCSPRPGSVPVGGALREPEDATRRRRDLPNRLCPRCSARGRGREDR
ncbi:recombinase family protein, partial [Streptomyces sp. NPDC002586]